MCSKGIVTTFLYERRVFLADLSRKLVINVVEDSSRY